MLKRYFCAARSAILRKQTSSSHHYYLYSASLLCFLNPEKLSIPTLILSAEKNTTFQKLSTYIVLEAWG